MKRLVQLILLLITINSLFANSLSEEENTQALVCVKDIVLLSCNYFISEVHPDIPNIKLRIPKNSVASDAIVFENLDMNSLLQYFPQQEINSNNIVQSLKEPLAFYVRDSLVKNNLQEGDTLVLGAVALAFKDNQPISEIVSDMINGLFPRIGVVTDITLSGGLFTQEVNIKGVFVLQEIDGSLGVQPLEMSINGEEVDVYFN